MNLVSVIVVALALLGAVRGYQTGLARMVFSSVGMVLGFVGGVRLAPSVVDLVDGAGQRLAVALVVALVLAALGATLGELVGYRVDRASDRLRIGRVTRSLGALLQAGLVLLLAWLLASGLAGVRAYDVGREIQTSAVIRGLNAVLPSPPDLLSRLESLISPNGFPRVFLEGEPQRPVIQPNTAMDPTVLAAVEPSVVEIAGAGCGGTIQGSGFVVAPGVVVTNAHVVSGVVAPRVLTDDGDLGVTVVLFDPDRDVAVLRVAGLQAPALPTTSGPLDAGAPGAVLGYPGGGPLRENDAAVISRTRALGQDIYGAGRVERDIYELATDVDPGSSGGPFITADGVVAGVVFAESVTQDTVGYALVWQDVADEVAAAAVSDVAVGTGACR